ncbi:MAG: hypothetical protein JSR58_01175 [Verrucomicrobia bacterium]|nr:hypothetical protein [Verrucomicrobiota bacterium]
MSAPVKELMFLACATVGFAWKSPRDSEFSTKWGQKLFAYGESISPTEEKSSGPSFWIRRPISNQIVHLAHLSEVASLATDALLDRVWGRSAQNLETEEKLTEMQTHLSQQLALIGSCEEIVVKFGENVEEFQTTNTERVGVHQKISKESASFSVPSNFSKQQEQLLSLLTDFASDCKTVAQNQSEQMKQVVQLQVLLSEQKQWNEKTSAQIQQLKQDLSVSVQEGVDTKKTLLHNVDNLTPLVEKATPDRKSNVPSNIRAGIKLVNRELFKNDTTSTEV